LLSVPFGWKMIAFYLLGFLPFLLLLSLVPALVFGRNRGDLFLIGQISTPASGKRQADLETLHRVVIDVGFGLIAEHPQVAKRGLFPGGEYVETERVYEFSGDSLTYLNRRLSDGVWLITMMAKPHSRAANELRFATRTLSEMIRGSFGLANFEISDDFGVIRDRG
jgi:hypothetical protein